ncbi:GNAT family N-acetyltransferase [Microbacterium aurantiacum]|uniref:GNAT family N-acetyltransferase n=2 Tax=Microbacterium aurantiacum TaxID=162393 RepID=A0AAJ2LYW0_9MICO|nr:MULTISPECIES: GNAT family N-acetyltransferase [Microbacterium]ODT09834.1 MAG: GNAT family N-acetyltransferase [Microbacterium sp. SCN 70-18]ANG86255.1 acetyltransferase [Microbacterium chocolatum]KOS10912.1 acetyltransferase [Microbacterium chocolatum]MBN9202536.1 GNAT family N-acetyltransferase [Microbacterium chocolatum]MDN4465191.1 GNAT family N-acetyltransferase [Microbacterium aurantiacum]
MPTPTIVVDDLSSSATRDLLARHQAEMRAQTPGDSCHVLDVEALRAPSITVWAAYVDGELAGVGALKTLDAARGEVKSMRVEARFLGRGVGRALVRHILAEARARGLQSLWLETGSGADFTAARALYASEGFTACAPFDDYVADPLSAYFTRRLAEGTATV